MELRCYCRAVSSSGSLRLLNSYHRAYLTVSRIQMWPAVDILERTVRGCAYRPSSGHVATHCLYGVVCECPVLDQRDERLRSLRRIMKTVLIDELQQHQLGTLNIFKAA